MVVKSAVVGVAALGGCFLPVATGAPQPATTVGRGRWGGGLHAEAPAVNLLAKDSQEFSPAAAGVATVALGITEHTDLEASLEGALYLFFLPLPTGGSLGLRQHLVEGDSFDLALAARAGWVGVSGDSNGAPEEASSTYGAVSLAAQGRSGAFRPLASVQAMAARITQRLGESDDGTFDGAIVSGTLAALFSAGALQIGPYLTASYLTSDRLDQQGLVSVGLALWGRRDRPRAAAAGAAPGSP